MIAHCFATIAEQLFQSRFKRSRLGADFRFGTATCRGGLGAMLIRACASSATSLRAFTSGIASTS